VAYYTELFAQVPKRSLLPRRSRGHGTPSRKQARVLTKLSKGNFVSAEVKQDQSN
jgi:hypothetical protein